MYIKLTSVGERFDYYQEVKDETDYFDAVLRGSGFDVS